MPLGRNTVELILYKLFILVGTHQGQPSWVIPQAGDYEISYNLLMSTDAAADIGVAVRNNGTIIPQTRGAQTLAIDDTTTLAYDGRLSGSTIVTLPANSVLDLTVAVLNTLPTRFNAIINGNANTTLTVKKLNA